MKVKVIVPKWGKYSQGDELEMEESTAKAIAKHGLIELPGEASDDDRPKKKGKDK